MEEKSLIKMEHPDMVRMASGLTGNTSLARHVPRIAAWLLIAAMLVTAGIADAADKKDSREREMLRRVQLELQQAREQSAVLEEEKNKLAQDLEQAAKAGKIAQARAARLGRELKDEQAKRVLTEKELAAANQRLAETEARLADTSKNLAETSRNLQQTEAEKKQLETIKTHNEREIALCEDKNGKLYKYGRELMVRYENKSFNDVVKQREPFTGLKQVEVENLLEEYRDKLDAEKIIKAPGRN